MLIKQVKWKLLAVVGVLASCLLAASPVRAQVGSTSVSEWKDGKKAVFLLMFDDSWPSHFQVAVPALVERKMTATFYINPGKGEFKVFKGKWEQEVWKAGMAYGNHTMTHSGVKDLENAKFEIGGCTQAILDMVPGKKPRLISYGQPGVGPGKWNISKEQLQTLLAENHLIDRPPFAGHGAVYHWKTTEQMLALADKAIAAGGMEYLVIHGVERRPPLQTKYQDFWALNQDIFFAVLDGLKERRDRGDLWITDHISYHQYLTEKATAKVQVVQTKADVITLKLTCQADPALYDQPLTLVTKVPATWSQCQVTQGGNSATVAAAGGQIRFDAAPGDEAIELRKLP